MAVLFETTVGDFVVDLFWKEREASCKQFLRLCKSKFYNLSQFFLIQKDYIAQTGEFCTKGRKDHTRSPFKPDYFIEAKAMKMKHRQAGTVSFVNNGTDLFCSQFFITLADDLDYLDGKHCIFGQINEGIDIVEKLNEQVVDDEYKPFHDIRISHVIILHDPFDVDEGVLFPSRSPSPTEDLLFLADKIALDQSDGEEEEKTAEELKKEVEQRELHSHAKVLEIMGDIGDVDEKPPDNVLFVCRLNPVTTDEDLEVIFSRFGEVKCCEIIRDRRNKKSLQYAFVEFASAEDCGRAYLKMDNVRIDDRRIHVDFSQSVAKKYTWDRKTESAKPSTSKEELRRRPSGPRTPSASPPPTPDDSFQSPSPRRPERNGDNEKRNGRDRHSNSRDDRSHGHSRGRDAERARTPPRSSRRRSPSPAESYSSSGSSASSSGGSPSSSSSASRSPSPKRTRRDHRGSRSDRRRR